MQIELLEILRCPKTGQRLVLRDPEFHDGKIRSASLLTEDGRLNYSVQEFIPRFVPATNYADNFGMQWNKFRQTQLDSYSGCAISAARFWKATGWRPEDIFGKWVLDVGCGAGRFAEVALSAGAKVLALDYSTAVDACYANLKHHPNLHVVQGNIYALPFAERSFPFVYSLGVLQHTPDVKNAFAALPPIVAEGGRLCTDFYWRRFRIMMHMKYLRPITKRISQDRLFSMLGTVVPRLLAISQVLGQVTFIGVLLKRLVPVADYTGVYPLNQQQLQEWALLDTFDMLGPQYDSPQSARTIRDWMSIAGLQDIELLQVNLLVVRGMRPRVSGDIKG